MTGASVGVLVVTALFAVGDWISRARDDRRLEYVCKPATTVGLILLAVLVEPADPAQRWWFVAALVASLAGDVLLMLPPSGRFVEGLASFFVAHLAYVVGFVVAGLDGGTVGVAVAFVVLVLGSAGAPILAGVRRSQPAFLVPVVAYFLVIGVMIVTAISSGQALAGVGAVLFAVSDSMIGYDRFVKPFAAASVGIMVTYHAAQLLLVLSLVH